MDEKELIGVDILLPSEYFAVFQYLLHKKLPYSPNNLKKKKPPCWRRDEYL